MPSHKVNALGLDDVTSGKQAKPCEDLVYDASHRGLACAGRPGKYHVLWSRRRSQTLASSHDAKKHSRMRIPRFDYTPPAAYASYSAAAARTVQANE
ncbi:MULTISPECIES: hypothetical protein [unclassified Streptomyces]|uniref:hypothetical protein n=1 Tax=unclassified Streptomyces TaxID=2593676 RepID=UPI00358E03F3